MAAMSKMVGIFRFDRNCFATAAAGINAAQHCQLLALGLCQASHMCCAYASSAGSASCGSGGSMVQQSRSPDQIFDKVHHK